MYPAGPRIQSLISERDTSTRSNLSRSCRQAFSPLVVDLDVQSKLGSGISQRQIGHVLSLHSCPAKSASQTLDSPEGRLKLFETAVLVGRASSGLIAL
ncbi:hypothetical protein DNTS_016136 [Danionella cerebrum]|uniref:Uncharacterized protein n=1 Tax=Danionella cerebrum TaxID=2873325 RepID=A0A553Q8S8_9TELE|nr:hypothetical protein DNTS_016136 [Danionella translucida]